MKKEWNLSPEQLKKEREIMEKLKQFDTPTTVSYTHLDCTLGTSLLTEGPGLSAFIRLM